MVEKGEKFHLSLFKHNFRSKNKYVLCTIILNEFTVDQKRVLEIF